MDEFTQTLDDDPFAGTDFGDFGQPESTEGDPFAGDETITGTEMPVVNAEGEQIGSAPPPATPDAVAEVSTGTEMPVEDAAPAEGKAQEPAGITDAELAADEAKVRAAETLAEELHKEAWNAHAATDAAKKEELLAARARAAEKAQEPGGEPVEASSSTVEEPAAEVPAEPAEPQTVDEAIKESTRSRKSSVPEVERSEDGRVVKRPYVILRLDGNDKYTKLSWLENRKGEIVETKGSGIKRTDVVMAPDHKSALAHGFVACGEPQDGTYLIPVARNNFVGKHVAPDIPPPQKRRLRIS